MTNLEPQMGQILVDLVDFKEASDKNLMSEIFLVVSFEVDLREDEGGKKKFEEILKYE